jgi:hypothetical protein
MCSNTGLSFSSVSLSLSLRTVLSGVFRGVIGGGDDDDVVVVLAVVFCCCCGGGGGSGFVGVAAAAVVVVGSMIEYCEGRRPSARDRQRRCGVISAR